MTRSIGSCILILAIASGAAVLFQDDFSGGSGNWSDLPTGAGRTVSSAGGKLTITCTNIVSIIKHNAVFTNFSLSVKMRPVQTAYNNVGVMFCLDSAINGYCLTQDNLQRLTLVKYARGTPTPLCVLPNSHIAPGENTITINRFGGRIEFFANRRFVASVTDASFAGGMIGFFVPEGYSVEYDDVVVTDQPFGQLGGGCFTYDFSDASLAGWYIAPEGTNVQASGGAMRLASALSDQNGTTVFYSGDYDSASIRLTASRVSGRDSAGYGIMLNNVHAINASSYVVDQEFLFVVNGAGQYGIKGPGANTYLMTSKLESPMHAAPAKDTLTLVRKPGAYLWYVNNILLDSAIIPGSYSANAIGLFVLAGVTVEFDDMTVGIGDQLVCPVTRSRHGASQYQYRLTPLIDPAALRFDVLGRSVLGCARDALRGVIIAADPVSPRPPAARAILTQ